MLTELGRIRSMNVTSHFFLHGDRPREPLCACPNAAMLDGRARAVCAVPLFQMIHSNVERRVEEWNVIRIACGESYKVPGTYVVAP